MAGIYIHIPFCKKKCSYCDFHFSTNYEKYRKDMINAIVLELLLKKKRISDSISSIYFGGGTPSLLTKDEIEKIINCIKENYRLNPSFEFTLEANPDDINEKNLTNWIQLGINRLSVGIQSFNDDILNWMNRAHNSNQAKDSIQLAQKMGITNINVDLIYGVPQINTYDLEQDIECFINLDTQHISAYCLTVEKGTLLEKQVTRQQIIVPNEDYQSNALLLVRKKLQDAGYLAYEISNFCKKGVYSQHNSNYWKNVNYIGVGPSAHSFYKNVRTWNVSNNTQYIQSLNKKTIPEEIELLSSKNQYNELILTGLRTVWGVSKEKLDQFSEYKKTKKTFQSFVSNGYIIENPKSYQLSEKGILLADKIASDLFIV